MDHLVAKYGEDKLLAMVRKKYGLLSPRREIEVLYTKYNPEKVAEIDMLVAKYGEMRLLSMIHRKYLGQASTSS